MSDHEQLWTAVAQLLRAQVSEAVWFSTFQDVVALDSDTSMLRVSAPNAHARDRILSRYLPLVRDALEDIGSSNLQFVIEVQVADTEQQPEWAPEPSVRDAGGHSGAPEQHSVHRRMVAEVRSQRQDQGDRRLLARTWVQLFDHRVHCTSVARRRSAPCRHDRLARAGGRR